jgi:hypothetical protein
VDKAFQSCGIFWDITQVEKIETIAVGSDKVGKTVQHWFDIFLVNQDVQVVSYFYAANTPNYAPFGGVRLDEPWREANELILLITAGNYP